jgi:uncharacterized protein YukJ
MDIYFSPEMLKEDCQILNIVDGKQKAVGYLTFLFDQKKMYVYGQLEDTGVRADFNDLVKPYIQGVKKAKPDLEVYSYLSVGGEKLDIKPEK